MLSLIYTLTAATDNIFGQVSPPPGVKEIGAGPEGLGILLNRILQFLVVGAGVYALINLVIAGYGFMSAGDDPKKIAGSWARIWQTLLGLAFAAGAFVLAGIFGQLIFNDPTFILNPKIRTAIP
ncbi:hypothetical protein MUP46_01320 [Patescibacteria group bacterium]|nr:hypothetical protein [Patescibacteria group bacterium]